MNTKTTTGSSMILANPFTREAEEHLKEYQDACERVIRSGWYILGREVEAFEKELATYLGVKETVGCANGLDALSLALKAIGVESGDEVITTPLSAAATALAITHIGAKVVFVDVLPETLALNPDLVKRAITPRTKAVIPVHLYGYPAQAARLKDFCDRHQLTLIEDCAQAIGAKEQGKNVGAIGSIGCFSFYPTKNLGAFGDAGALSTNDPALAAKLRKWRNYGQRVRYDHELPGYNSRLDELQAALLRTKLKQLGNWTRRRQEIAKRYDNGLAPLDIWKIPQAEPQSECVYHLYPIQTDRRDEVLEHFKKVGIESLVHYPTLIPEQQCYAGQYASPQETYPVAYRASRKLLSLPISPYLTNDEVDRVIEELGRALK